MAERGGSRVHERWARLAKGSVRRSRMEWQDEGRPRFSVIGQLLVSPPAKGELRAALKELAAREWRHPSTGKPVRFGVSTLERWLYCARNELHDPVSVLRRKRRGDDGEQTSMTPLLRQALLAQYDAHKSWSASLHHDNLVALAETRAELRPVPSYATVRRFLAAHGLTKRRPMTTRQTEGALAAAARLEARSAPSAWVFTAAKRAARKAAACSASHDTGLAMRSGPTSSRSYANRGRRMMPLPPPARYSRRTD